jgi:50S ribosomal protein L16 3-hydroxylase
MTKNAAKTSIKATKTTISSMSLSSTVAPNLPLKLLGGITPAEFMSKYWQKKPLLIRGAISEFKPLLSRDELFALAEQDDVESRLIVENSNPKRKKSEPAWKMATGPFCQGTTELPPLKKANWTLLVQGVDLHGDKLYALKNQFRFAPDARLDDVMISFATDGGGVGPHFDSYDVFLLQAEGQRRWRIGKQKDLTLLKDVPLKILANFKPEQEFVLEAGDMLYLPPKYAHEGVAVGECMTYSIGFRTPEALELAGELLHRFADDALEGDEEKVVDKVLYKDPKQAAVETPALIPLALLNFAQQAVEKAMADPHALARHFGEYLTEPKANVWFDEPEIDVILTSHSRVDLHPRSQMLFDSRHIFLNGMSWHATGADAKLMKCLANQRFLDAKDLTKASDGAMALLQEWLDAGWLL